MNDLYKAAILVSLSLGLVACSRTNNQQADGDKIDPAATEVPADGVNFSTPKNNEPSPEQRKPAKSDPAVSRSWTDTISRLPADKRDYLQAANSRYLGLLNYDSPEEYARLSALGFPSAQQWNEFHRLGDDELKRRADAGDHYARLFHADRLAGLVAKVPETFGNRNARIERMGTDANVHSAIALRQGKDAFSAYVHGYALSAQHGRQEPMAAALMIGFDLGDERASRALRDFNRNYPDVRPDIIQLYYQGMKRIVRLPN